MTPPPVALSLTETDSLEAPVVFSGILSECKAYVAKADRALFARRADDGRMLFELSPGALRRLQEQRVTESDGRVSERTVKTAEVRLATRAFDKTIADLDVFSERNFHHAAQVRAIKKAGLKISKWGGSVEVDAAHRAALIAALRGEGFAVVDYHGRPVE